VNYRPNFLPARSGFGVTFTIGVIASEIGDAYGSQVISGIEQYLHSAITSS